MIKVLSYCIIIKKGKTWTVNFKGDNYPLSYVNPLYIGFKNEKGRWVVFEVTGKRVEINGPLKIYTYSADFLGYSPDVTIDLDKVDFEWITDEEIIERARDEARWT